MFKPIDQLKRRFKTIEQLELEFHIRHLELDMCGVTYCEYCKGGRYNPIIIN